MTKRFNFNKKSSLSKQIPTKVICAIIEYTDGVLVVQRSSLMKQPLKWEFPGGKLENGESEKECIIREIKEELNIVIEPIKRLKPSVFSYPNITIELIPYITKHIQGDPVLTEHKAFLILEKKKLSSLDWAEADVPIVNEYISYE